MIENAPLQAYASALVFSPSRSLVRTLFKAEEPNLITTKPALEGDWNACLQTLEGHRGGVWSVAVSADGNHLASGSGDRTVKIWDAATGKSLHTIYVGTSLDNLSFDPTGSYLTLLTKVGRIEVDSSPGLQAITP